MALRKIIEIDEEKCDGCGLCVPGCAEGALRIVNGKAKLVSEVYCDGLGACLGECPRGAIRIIEREASAFDEAAVQRHLAITEKASAHTASPTPAASPVHACPGARMQSFSLPLAPVNNGSAGATSDAGRPGGGAPSALRHWPVQLRLIPPGAPFLQGAHLLLVADCVPVAMPDFHRLLTGRVVALACPKFDNAQDHVAKLAAILAEAAVESITVARMEVPCCGGLQAIAQAAIQASGRQMPLGDIIVSTRGEVLSEVGNGIGR